MNNIKLTILMPSFNKEKFIKKAINSVLNQKTNFDFKIVVTDDCSTDKTINIVSEYAEKFPNKIIVLPSEKNQGLLSNIIKAYEYLIENPSPYFCCLDADDYLTDMNFYQKAIDFLDKNIDYNIYAANTSVLSSNGEIYIQNTHIKENFINSSFSDMLEGREVLGNTISSVFRNCIINSDLIEKIKKNIGDNYLEHSYRDDDFRNRIHLENSRAHYKNEVAGMYRITQEGLYQGSNDLKKVLLKTQAYIDMYYFFEKKYPQFMDFALKQADILLAYINKLNEYNPKDIIEFCSVIKILSEYNREYIINLILNTDKPKKHKVINFLGLKIKLRQ